MLFLPDTLSATYWLCLLNDKEVFQKTPNILGHLTSGRCEFLMNILGWILAWCVSGVCNVTEDFQVEISKELSFRYAVISSR